MSNYFTRPKVIWDDLQNTSQPCFVKTVCVVKISEWSTAMTRFISFSFLMRLNDEYV